MTIRNMQERTETEKRQNLGEVNNVALVPNLTSDQQYTVM